MKQIAKWKRSAAIMAMLVAVFSVYNYRIYSEMVAADTTLCPEAIHGQELWQQYNCNSCHQLYGLGGYLGPDLTNIYSDPNKGPECIKAMFNAGSRSMPVFHFSETEKKALLAYLNAVDQTGYYPDYKAKIETNGWVNISSK